MNIQVITRFVNIFRKYAQDQTNTPNITIQPGRPETNCALDILKLWNPNFFVGVFEIVVHPSANYGFVESGEGKNPKTIHINADRIVAESGGQQNGKAAALAAASVIAHEKGHVASFTDEQGFVGGESPAEAQEQELKQWLNSGGMSRIENLPSYQSLTG